MCCMFVGVVVLGVLYVLWFGRRLGVCRVLELLEVLSFCSCCRCLGRCMSAGVVGL